LHVSSRAIEPESAAAAPVAIVTAAGKGMGAAIARRLSSDGYLLALFSNGGGAAELATELGGDRAIGLTGSITDPEALSQLVTAAVDSFGRVDALINNTGHPPKGELLGITDPEWQQGFEMIVLNVIRLARLVIPIMERQGGGSIVNISTYSAFEPEASAPVSGVFRAALGSVTKLYADRYAQSGIRVNNILPGFIDSYPLSDKNLARIPMGRYGMVEEIAGTVAFLLSADAGYITGQNLRVDGGITRAV
jgi:NAD(P)-dependent dehydrogenase (short-subunit alcohol dehydrogenase family)